MTWKATADTYGRLFYYNEASTRKERPIERHRALLRFFFYQLLRCTKLRHLATLLLALSGNEICEEREKKIGLNESSNEKPPPTAAEHQARASATRTRVRRKCPTFLSFFFVCGLRAWRRKRQRKLIKRFSLFQSTDFNSKGANEEKQMREKQKWKALAWLR